MLEIRLIGAYLKKRQTLMRNLDALVGEGVFSEKRRWRRLPRVLRSGTGANLGSMSRRLSIHSVAEYKRMHARADELFLAPVRFIGQLCTTPPKTGLMS